MNPSYSECVSIALDIKHAKRMRHVAVACLHLPYFFTSFRKRNDVLVRVIEPKMYALIFSTNFV